MEKSLTVQLVYEALIKVLNCPNLLVSDISNIGAVDRALCLIELPLVSYLGTHNFGEITTDLAQQTMNGYHDKSEETDNALKYLFKLLNMSNRAGRMAALKLVVEITNLCIDAWQEPSQTFMTVEALESLVNYLFKKGIEKRWNDVGSYPRAYICAELTSWYTRGIELVNFDKLVQIIVDQMLDLSPSQTGVRAPAMKQLVIVCKHTPDRAKATQILEKYREVFMRICECTTDATGRRCVPYAFELLSLGPRPECEWVMTLLSQYVNELASVNNVQAVIQHLLTCQHYTFRQILSETSLDGAENQIHFGQCLARLKNRNAEECLSTLLKSESSVIANGELMKYITIFQGFSRLAPPDYVYDIVAFQVGKCRYATYPASVNALLASSRRGPKSYGIKYFNILSTIFSHVGKEQESTNERSSMEWIPQTLQALGELVRKWDYQTWEDGGKRVTDQVKLSSVPLNLAGYVAGHTDFKRAEETRQFLLLLTTAKSDCAPDLASACSKFLFDVSAWEYASFAGNEELIEVTKMFLELCSSLYAYEGRLPSWLQHKLDLKRIYGDLGSVFAHTQLSTNVTDKETFDQVVRNLYILEKLKCTRSDLCVSSVLPQLPFQNINVHFSTDLYPPRGNSAVELEAHDLATGSTGSPAGCTPVNKTTLNGMVNVLRSPRSVNSSVFPISTVSVDDFSPLSRPNFAIPVTPSGIPLGSSPPSSLRSAQSRVRQVSTPR